MDMMAEAGRRPGYMDDEEGDVRGESQKNREKARQQEEAEAGLPKGRNGDPLIPGDPAHYRETEGAKNKVGTLLAIDDGRARVRFADNPSPLGVLLEFGTVMTIPVPEVQNAKNDKLRALHASHMEAFNAAQAAGKAAPEGSEGDAPPDPAPEPAKATRGRKGKTKPAAEAEAKPDHSLSNSGLPDRVAVLGAVKKLQEFSASIESMKGKERAFKKKLKAEHNIDVKILTKIIKDELAEVPDVLIDRENHKQGYRSMLGLPAYAPLPSEVGSLAGATDEAINAHAEKEGHRAGIRGATRETVPYPEEAPTHEYWMRGYDEAQKEITAALQKLNRGK